MAIFMPVLPTKLYQHLDTPFPHAHTFVHAPQVARDSNLCAWLRDGERHQIFVDCFAYELGGNVPDLETLFTALDKLQSKDLVIVCPDVIHNHEATMQLLLDHGKMLSAYGRLMLVPHSTSPAKWFYNAQEMIETTKYFLKDGGMLIGIPRYTSEWNDPAETPFRMQAATWLRYYHPRIRVHLLGAGRGLNEVIRVTRACPNVRTVDSTTPFVWAVNHGIYDIITAKEEMPSDWWDLAWMIGRRRGHSSKFVLDEQTLIIAQLNIAIWKRALEDGHV